MNLIDFNELKITDFDKSNVEEYIIDLEMEERLDTDTVSEFMTYLEHSFYSLISHMSQYENEAVLVVVNTDLSEMDINLVADNITGSFVTANMTGNKADKDEYRLDVPEDLHGLVMLANHIMDCVNSELTVPVFNIVMKDKDGIIRTTLIGKDLI